MVKNRFLLFIGLIFFIFNFLINYIPMNNVIILIMVVLAWISILFLNNEAATKIDMRRKILISVISFIIEILIFVVSALIFESGLFFTISKISLWENNRFISLYAVTGVFIIKELIKYFYINKKKL